MLFTLRRNRCASKPIFVWINALQALVAVGTRRNGYFELGRVSSSRRGPSRTVAMAGGYAWRPMRVYEKRRMDQCVWRIHPDFEA